MENNSKLHAKMMYSTWSSEKNKNDPNYWLDYTIRRKNDLSMYKLTSKEIDTIIKTMKQIRSLSFYTYTCEMAYYVKLDVYILRCHLKPFFRNQSHVEEDIEDFIETIFKELDVVYDYSMKEICWTMNFLLSQSHPPSSIEKEVADLRSYLFKVEQYAEEYIKIMFELYKNHFMRQLSEDVCNDFELKDEKYFTSRITHFHDRFLDPFKDPEQYCEDSFQDDFTSFIKTICKICGMKFKSNTILKHLAHPDVKCSQHYEHAEMKDLNTIVPNSKILQGSIDTGREKKQKDYIKLINNSVEEYSNVFSIRHRFKIEFAEKEMSKFLENHDVPDHLITRHKQKVKEANRIYDELTEECNKVKLQILEELGPSDTWAKENQKLIQEFIRKMAENLKNKPRNMSDVTEVIAP